MRIRASSTLRANSPLKPSGFPTASPLMYPLPEKGETVFALDRAGQELGEAVVTAVKQTKKMDQTATVIIELPREWSMTARAIRLKR